MTPTQLRTLILAQPEGSPIRVAFAAGEDMECANRFPAAKIQYGDPAPVRVTELGLFLANANVLSKIHDAANEVGVHTPARNVALLVILLIGSGFERPVDPNDAGTQGMMAALKSANLITLQHEEAWLAYCRPYLLPTGERIEAARKAGN